MPPLDSHHRTLRDTTRDQEVINNIVLIATIPISATQQAPLEAAEAVVVVHSSSDPDVAVAVSRPTHTKDA